MKQFLQVFVICLFMSGLILCLKYTSPKDETTVVQATVIDKEYIEDYYDFGYYYDWWKGKFRWKYKYFPQEFNVIIKYNDIVETFDNQELYEEVDIGDSIDVELTTYFDLDGEIRAQSICLIN